MKREIKYRCFDKQWKTMSEVTMLLFSSDELDHKGNMGEPKVMDHFEVMQYTGLKDKNGVEIYDMSDVVQHNDNKYVFVKTVNMGLVAVCINSNFGTILNDRLLKVLHNYRTYNQIYRIQKYIEVIGNIYENPELL